MSSGSTDIEYIKTARREHRCTWCFEIIRVGESYKRWRSFVDGSASTVNMHNECHQDLLNSSDGYDDGFTPGEGIRPKKEIKS